MLRRARRAFGAGVALVVVSLAVGAGPASAHNVLISTDPADGSTVQSTPDAITLTFNEPAVALGTQIQVTGPDGSELAVGEPRLVDNSVVQPLAEERPAGAYQVVWRVTSADGHPIEGELAFEATDAVGAAESPDPQDAADEPTAPTGASDEPVTDAPADESTPTDEAAAGADGTADDAEQAANGDEQDSAGSPPWWIVAAAVAAGISVLVIVITRRRDRT